MVHSKKNTDIYRKYISGGRKKDDEIKLSKMTDFVSNLITAAKDSYFTNLGKKLNDPGTSPKTYWSILKMFLNKIKIPEILPLLVNGIFETDFRKKASIFNVFFTNQCSILNNGSIIAGISYKTDKRTRDINLLPSDLSKIIKNLNPNKAHGHDNISVKMIQMCGDTIIPPLTLIFDSAIKSGLFLIPGKK